MSLQHIKLKPLFIWKAKTEGITRIGNLQQSGNKLICNHLWAEQD